MASFSGGALVSALLTTWRVEAIPTGAVFAPKPCLTTGLLETGVAFPKRAPPSGDTGEGGARPGLQVSWLEEVAQVGPLGAGTQS